MTGKTAMTVDRVSERAGGRRRRTVKRPPTISIVGAGRLGTALARALAAKRYRVEAVVAGTKLHASKAADLLGRRPLALASTQLEQLPSSDILIITTPDDRIGEIATRLAAIFERDDRKVKGRGADKVNRGRTVIHASGALSSAILRPMRAAGFGTGSMHPLVSVSDSLQGAESLCTAYFCVEGTPSAVRVMRGLIHSLGAQSFSISADNKALYHAAAVMASGHTTALFDIAVEMFTRCGLTARRARSVLLPLLKTTFENLYANEPSRALTGTFARADTTTVAKHLKALSSPGMRDALAVYALLGRRSLGLAEMAGARPESVKEIAGMLEETGTLENE